MAKRKPPEHTRVSRGRVVDDGTVPGTPYSTDVLDFGDKQIVENGPGFNQGLRNLFANIFTTLLASSAQRHGGGAKAEIDPNTGGYAPDLSSIFRGFMPQTLGSLGVPHQPWVPPKGFNPPNTEFWPEVKPPRGGIPDGGDVPGPFPYEKKVNKNDTTGLDAGQSVLNTLPGGERIVTPPNIGQAGPNQNGGPADPNYGGNTLGGQQITPQSPLGQAIPPKYTDLASILKQFAGVSAGGPDAPMTHGFSGLLQGNGPLGGAPNMLGLNLGSLNSSLYGQGYALGAGIPQVVGNERRQTLDLFGPDAFRQSFNADQSGVDALRALLGQRGVSFSPLSAGYEDESSLGPSPLAAALPYIAMASGGLDIMSKLKGLFGGGPELPPAPSQAVDNGMPYQPTFNDNGNNLQSFMQMLQMFGPGGMGPSPASAGFDETMMGIKMPDFGQYGPLQGGATTAPPNILASMAQDFSLPSYQGSLHGGQMDPRQSWNVTSGYNGPMQATPLSTNVGPANSTYNGPTATSNTALQRQATDHASQFLNANPFGSTQNIGNTLNEMITTGGRFDLTPQFDALANINRQRIADQSAAMNESFGARGLRFGTDLARATGDMTAKVLNEEQYLRANMAQQAFENASNRRLQASMMPGQLMNQQFQNFSTAYGMGAQERGANQQDIMTGMQFGEMNRGAQERGMDRSLNLGAMNMQNQNMGIDRGLQFGEANRGAQERNIERQMRMSESNTAANERAIQRAMAEYARTQGALFPLLLQFSMAGTEGDQIILGEEDEEEDE